MLEGEDEVIDIYYQELKWILCCHSPYYIQRVEVLDPWQESKIWIGYTLEVWDRKYDVVGKRNSSKLDTASGDIDVFSSRQCYHPTRLEGLKANRPSQIDDITIQVSPSRTISFNWLTGEIYNSSVLGTHMRTHWVWEPKAHYRIESKGIVHQKYETWIW